MAGPAQSGSGVGSWAARPPRRGRRGVASGLPTRSDRGPRASAYPRPYAAGSERFEAPRWSVGRPPRAPRP
eukprot:6213152-Pleurochrysis_carterae.AAC.1